MLQLLLPIEERNTFAATPQGNKWRRGITTCPTADPRRVSVGVLAWARYAFGVSYVFTQQRGIPAKGSTCGVVLVGIGQPLLSPYPRSQSFQQESDQAAQAHSLLLVNLCWLFHLSSDPWQRWCWVLQVFLYFLSLHCLPPHSSVFPFIKFYLHFWN